MKSTKAWTLRTLKILPPLAVNRLTLLSSSLSSSLPGARGSGTGQPPAAIHVTSDSATGGRIKAETLDARDAWVSSGCGSATGTRKLARRRQP